MRRRVAVDALGGDHPPEEIVAGAVAAANEGVEPVIFGPAELDTHGLAHVVTSEMVEMDDKPAEVVRLKPDSSLVRAVRAVGDGDADAVVRPGTRVRCSQRACSTCAGSQVCSGPGSRS